MSPGQIKNPVIKIVIADNSSLLKDRIKSLLNSLNKISVMYEINNGVEGL